MLNIGLVERPAARSAAEAGRGRDPRRDREIAGIEVSVGFDRPIYVAVLGNDSQALARVAKRLAEKMKKIPGITDVELSVKPASRPMPCG